MSPEQFGNIFSQSMVNGILTGLGIFLKAAWPYILLLIAFKIIEGIIKKRKRKK